MDLYSGVYIFVHFIDRFIHLILLFLNIFLFGEHEPKNRRSNSILAFRFLAFLLLCIFLVQAGAVCKAAS